MPLLKVNTARNRRWANLKKNLLKSPGMTCLSQTKNRKQCSMTAITASLVSELRKMTGAGMMECKKALTEMGGDLKAAEEHMRKTGLLKAGKKASRVAA